MSKRSKERIREVALSQGDSIRGSRQWKPKTQKGKAKLATHKAIEAEVLVERSVDKACTECACSTCLHRECLRDYCPAGHASQNKPLSCERCTPGYRTMAGGRQFKVNNDNRAFTNLGAVLQAALMGKG